MRRTVSTLLLSPWLVLGSGFVTPASSTSTLLWTWGYVHSPYEAPPGGVGAVSDDECDRATALCPESGEAAGASGINIDRDAGPFRFDGVLVWGSYDSGVPPPVDSFTVRVHVSPELGLNLPAGEVICEQTGIAGKREPASRFLENVWAHKLPFDAPCTFDPERHPDSDLHVEVFNDTGGAADWIWYPGGAQSDPKWTGVPPSAYATQAPGVSWQLSGMDFSLATGHAPLLPGRADGLTITRLDTEHIRLDWESGCGASYGYSIYRGDLHEGWSSVEAMTCQVIANTITLVTGSASQFFVVVPHNFLNEGIYGTDSEGNPRTPPVLNCYGEGPVDPCAE